MTETIQEQKAIKSWEQYLIDGLEAREQKDGSAWKLGDLSLGISKDYGSDSIGKYAYAIGVERKTLMNYRTVASTFTTGLRNTYRKLSFSHFAVLTNVEKPEPWLIQADNNEWNVETLRKEVNKAYLGLKEPILDDKPPKVIKCLECGLWRLEGMSSFEICRGHYKLGKNGLQYE